MGLDGERLILYVTGLRNLLSISRQMRLHVRRLFRTSGTAKHGHSSDEWGPPMP